MDTDLCFHCTLFPKINIPSMYKLFESVVTLCCFQKCAFSTFGLYHSSHFWPSTLCLSTHTCLGHHFVIASLYLPLCVCVISLSSPSYCLEIFVCLISLSSHVCPRRHFTDFEFSRLQSKPIKGKRDEEMKRGERRVGRGSS